MSVVCPNPEDHVPFPNPTKSGTCVKCGMPIPKPEPKPEPAPKKDWREDEDDGPLEEGNTALWFSVGERVTVRTAAGEFTGTIKMTRQDVIWLFSESGSAWLRTAAIRSYTNLDVLPHS